MRHLSSLVMERGLPVSPAAAWAAWSTPAARRLWVPATAVPAAASPTDAPAAEESDGALPKATGQTAPRRAQNPEPDISPAPHWLELSEPPQAVSAETIALGDGTRVAALMTAEFSTPTRTGTDCQLRLTLQLSAPSEGALHACADAIGGRLARLEALCHRLMVIEREIEAPPAVLWQAWTDPARLPQWWGPEGFSCRTKRIDLRPGGGWVFDMIGPDGRVYPNHHRYGAFEPGRSLGYTLLAGEDGPFHAEAWASFRPTPRGSLVTLGMVFASAEDRRITRDFGAEALGLETLGKLARAVGAP